VKVNFLNIVDFNLDAEIHQILSYYESRLPGIYRLILVLLTS